jgi:hypothetical protein
MKKILCVFLVALFMGVVSYGQAMAAPWSATLDDVAGTYNVLIHSKFKVNKLGKPDVNDTTGQLILATDGTVGTFVLNIDSPSTALGGGFSLVNKGKKILFSPTEIDELKDALSDWVISQVDPGTVLSSITFEIVSLKATKAKIDKNTKKAVKKITLTIKGTIYVEGTDDVGDFAAHSKFTYQTKITIQ